MSSVVELSTSLTTGGGRCGHATSATAIEVVRKAHGPKLLRHTCGLCHRGWWERDGAVVDVGEALALIKRVARLPKEAMATGTPMGDRAPQGPSAAPPEPPPAGFVALLGWVAQAIETTLVVFAVAEHPGWRTVSLPPAAPGVERATGALGRRGARPAVVEALRSVALLNVAAQLRAPSVFPKSYLATNFPDILASRVGTVVAAALNGAGSQPRAVIVAGYEELGAHAPHHVSPATVGSMGKLLATAYRRLGHYSFTPPPPFEPDGHDGLVGTSSDKQPVVPTSLPSALLGDPDTLMRPNEVAAIFQVHPRSINNWVASGTVPAVHTPGGHIRIRRGDVADLYLSRGPGAL